MRNLQLSDKIGEPIHLKPISCLLSEEALDDMNENIYRGYLNKELLISAIDGSFYSKIRMKNYPFEADWFLNDTIDFNRKG